MIERENPFREAYEGDEADATLVAGAPRGERDALEGLVRRHQGFVFNLALRTAWNAADAEDATQEILIKIVTALASFRAESAFRTWAYAIAVNHVRSRRRSRSEEVISGFECYARALAELPDGIWPDGSVPSAEAALIAEEAKVGCTVGMLLCLDREQRLAFVLGEILGASDAVGSALLGMSRDNYRQRLSRARRQLGEFLRGRCGLADPANPCRCARKTQGFIRAGIVDPARLQFSAHHLARVGELAPRRAQEIDRLAGDLGRALEDHPLQAAPDFAARIGGLVEA